MPTDKKSNIHDLEGLRNRTGVFADRREAGSVLAEMMACLSVEDGLVLAIPAGGVPVATVVAGRLDLPLEVAAVSKITPSWNTEVGYGAVAWDGTEVINHRLAARMGVDEQEVARGRAAGLEKVHRRVSLLRGGRAMPDLAGRTVVLIDDGIASGVTVRCAIDAIRRLGASQIILAAPTAHSDSLAALARKVSAVYCPNVRSGWSFAVADAYRHWRDVGDEEAAAILARSRRRE